jgi:hypothetical protein
VRSGKSSIVTRDQVRFDRRAPVGMFAPFGWRNVRLRELYQCETADELASLMNTWRERAVGDASKIATLDTRQTS